MKTSNGKSISVVKVPASRYVKIQFDSGGELPAMLTGLFTSTKLAYLAIEKYLASSVKGKKNAK